MGCFRYVYILLAGIVVVAGLGAVQDRDRSLQLQRLPRMLDDTREQMNGIAGYLRDFEKAHGRYPTNDEGLLAAKPLVAACDWDSNSDKPILHCRVRDSGILTRWGDPFVYENRIGINPRQFADSPANLDHNRLYSVRVDKDVYVWSVGARQACDKLALWSPRLNVATGLVWLIALGLVALFVRDSVISRARPTNAAKRWTDGMASMVAGLLLAMFIPACLLPIFAKSCYEGSIMWPRRPELTRDYKALLSKYRDRGVIKEATYKKITAAMELHDDSPR